MSYHLLTTGMYYILYVPVRCVEGQSTVFSSIRSRSNDTNRPRASDCILCKTLLRPFSDSDSYYLTTFKKSFSHFDGYRLETVHHLLSKNIHHLLNHPKSPITSFLLLLSIQSHPTVITIIFHCHYLFVPPFDLTLLDHHVTPPIPP
jgi:hypothetical protein